MPSLSVKNLQVLPEFQTKSSNLLFTPPPQPKQERTKILGKCKRYFGLDPPALNKKEYVLYIYIYLFIYLFIHLFIDLNTDNATDSTCGSGSRTVHVNLCLFFFGRQRLRSWKWLMTTVWRRLERVWTARAARGVFSTPQIIGDKLIPSPLITGIVIMGIHIYIIPLLLDWESDDDRWRFQRLF